MIVRTSIVFEFDSDNMEDLLLNEFSTDPVQFEEEFRNYALDCTIDDIYSFVKYGELTEAINVEVIK